ncbi:hypothetical protein KUH03_21165 [Sphingobacterium sp. E70]|uniref:hypothetical protein n=1 Tax=Sphingobacterium sp. E70 TaxID=2853439 RepID=UPI00211C3242|nr:hypothetical protein [Sphingobacterium sp. E70]ULT28754.1 hypothetical protein KUH03_21165 [Sphingobacterium sp. E70]
MHREGTSAYVGYTASNDTILNKENLSKITPEQKAEKRKAGEGEVEMMIRKISPIILSIKK